MIRIFTAFSVFSCYNQLWVNLIVTIKNTVKRIEVPVAANKNPKNQPVNHPKKKKHHQQKQNKPHGHYCYVCGEHKPNEKFSGSGHANHICRECQALPVAERNEMIAIRKLENMAFRHLSETEIKWMRGKLNDSRPEVKAAAREAHGIKFPYYERNMMKKGLTARSLEFFIHGEVWDEYGDEVSVHMRFFADNSGVIRRVDYSAPESEQETTVNIGVQSAIKFLKAVVHQLNAPFWSEDLSDAEPDYDPYLDILPEYRPDYYTDEDFSWALYINDEGAEDAPEDDTAEDKEPVWSLKLSLTKGYGDKTQTFYNQMHQEPQELFWSLMEWFDQDDDEFDEDFDEDDDNLDSENDNSGALEDELITGAICKICGSDMTKADGCKPSVFIHDGKQYERFRVGEPGDFYEDDGDNALCTDCGAKHGHYHHPGCDCEICPICGGQLLSCGCKSWVVYLND